MMVIVSEITLMWPFAKKGNGICIASRLRIPPAGFVIKEIVIPPATIITADAMFAPKRMYGEISYLSSKTPTTRDRNDAKKIDRKMGEKGRKNKLVIKTPKNKGIPPPRGIGFECSIAGCLCIFGSSYNFAFLIQIIQRGVARRVMIHAIRNGILMVI